MDATGLRNIGYKYFDKPDFTYLSHLSMGMLDNIFCSQSMYQKIQDAKIDYSHKPIWPSSNHLPMIIDVDTTWYGGWGSPKLPPPIHKSMSSTKGKGEQDQTRRSNEYRNLYDNYDHNGYHNYMYDIYTDPSQGVHSKYAAMPKQKPPPPVKVANAVVMNEDEEEEELSGEYQDENVLADEDISGDMNGYMQMASRYSNEESYRGYFTKVGTGKVAQKAAEEQMMWVLDAIKWCFYAMIGVLCLIGGVCIGWLFVGFWRGYKGRVVHYSRFP